MRRVLVVDDSRSVQETVRRALAGMQHVEVTACGDVLAAEDLLARVQPDLILCDVVLPGRPGYDLCRQVTRNREGTRPLVYLLSGTFEPFDADAARESGADAVITKPFSPEEIRSRLEEALTPRARIDADDGSSAAAITAADLQGAPSPPPATPSTAAPSPPASAIDELAARLERPLAERLLEPVARELARRLAASGGPLEGAAASALREAAERLVAERLQRLEDEAAGGSSEPD